MGEIVNKVRLAKILGKSERTLTEWQKEGMPTKKKGARGQSNTYDTAKVIEWLIKKESDAITKMDAAKLRLVEAQAELEELKVAEKKEELIPIDKMKLLWSGVLGTFRQRIQSLPSRLTPLIIIQNDPKKIEKVIKDGCNEALNELAMYDPEAYEKAKPGRAGGAKGSRATPAA